MAVLSIYRNKGNRDNKVHLYCFSLSGGDVIIMYLIILATLV